jgi:hypothetical protein
VCFNKILRRHSTSWVSLNAFVLIKYQGTCPKHAGFLARHILFPCSVKLQNCSLALPHEDTYTVAFLLSAARSSGLTTYTNSCPFSKCRTESCPFHLSKVHLVPRVCFWLILCATATLWSFSGSSLLMRRSSPQLAARRVRARVLRAGVSAVDVSISGARPVTCMQGSFPLMQKHRRSHNRSTAPQYPA